VTAGEWVQSIIGVIGIIATLLVAAMVYRLQVRDRGMERVDDKETWKLQEETRINRELQLLNRQENSAHLNQLGDALETLNAALSQIYDEEPILEDWLESSRTRDALQVVETIGRRFQNSAENFAPCR